MGWKLIFKGITLFTVSSEIVEKVFLWRGMLMFSEDNSGFILKFFKSLWNLPW